MSIFAGIESTRKKPHVIATTFGMVGDSPDFQRVSALRRRELVLDKVPDLTPLVRRPGGSMSLLPIQSAALLEASMMRGLFAPIPVGNGKTLITLLLPSVLDSKKAVILVPAQLRNQIHREAESYYGPHFQIPFDRIHVVAYSELSNAGSADVLETIKPDLVVADEAHRLKNVNAARTKRFLRYMKDDNVRFCALSGTMTSRSLMDYYHLIVRALYKNAPMPLNWKVAKYWANALDARPELPFNAGVLRAWCVGDEPPREGYRRRLWQSLGVVAMNENEDGLASLLIRKLRVSIPDAVMKRIHEVRTKWSIDGEEFDGAATRALYLRQLACGFYYRWDWPNGIIDWEWLRARSEWHKFIRETLEYSKKNLDSPFLVYRACERFEKLSRGERLRKTKHELPVIDSPQFRAWRMVEDRPKPPTKHIWIDEFLVNAALARANAEKKKGNVIIWYDLQAFEEPFRRRGIPVYGEGTDAGLAKEPIIACSVGTQSIGKNLQFVYSRNIILSMPPNGVTVQQLFGRTHRKGQEADEVTVDWFGHTPELEAAFAQAIEDATYQEQTGNGRQKILFGTKIDDLSFRVAS